MKAKEEVPMEELLFKDINCFGQAMYKTGQLLKLTGDLKSKEPKNMDKEGFELQVEDDYKQLTEGPVEIVTECFVRRMKNGSD